MIIGWRPRPVPLAPRAAVARGAVAGALARRLRELDDAALGALVGVVGDGVLAVLGEAAALPWVDGVVYLGRDDAAPRLLLPTALAPTVPAALLERALLGRGGAAPIGVVVRGDGEPVTLLGLGAARPIDRARLAGAGPATKESGAP